MKKTGYISIITSIILALGFLMSAHYCIGSYYTFTIQRKQAICLSKEYKLLKRYRKEIEKRASLISEIKVFSDRAGSFGLSKDEWDYYPVSINDNFFISEVAGILDQSASSQAYYFRPKLLEIKKRTGPKDEMENREEKQEQDIYLNLKGAFIAKKR